MKRIWRFALLTTVVLGCALVRTRPQQPRALIIQGLTYGAPPIYALWFQEAHVCALNLQRLRGDSAGFTVDTVAVDLSAITWIAVPTERYDGSFAGMLRQNGDSLFVWGMTSARGDTMWLPAPFLQVKRFVKHEAMHIVVHSPGEQIIGAHGLPWGFCEYL